MRTLAAIAVGAAAMVAGCAQTEARVYEQDGNLRIDPTNMLSANYIVQIRNVVDIGFGFYPAVRGERNEMALRALKTHYPAGQIVQEDVLELGGPGGLIPIGGPQRTFLIYVKC